MVPFSLRQRISYLLLQDPTSVSFHLSQFGNSVASRMYLTKMDQTGMLLPVEGHKMIDFKNLIVGRHESKVLFTWNRENRVSMLGAFMGIEDGIEAILARDGITPAQRAVLEEFRAIAGQNNWDFAALRRATG